MQEATLPSVQTSQRATALDIFDFLQIAAFEYLAKQLYNAQELPLDRETCCRLLAFLQCNSLIDCSKKILCVNFQKCA